MEHRDDESMPSQIFKADKVIIFEGIKGSGKSTQIQEAQKTLSSDSRVKIIDSRIVYPAVEQFRPRQITNVAAAVQEAIFFRFTRWLAATNNTKSEIALVDRFTLSDLVYLMQRFEKLGIVYDQENLHKQMLAPFGIDSLSNTLTLLIDCPADLARERIKERSRCNFDLTTEAKARELYLSQIGFVRNHRIIDGSYSQEEITRTVREHISEYLQK